MTSSHRIGQSCPTADTRVLPYFDNIGSESDAVEEGARIEKTARSWKVQRKPSNEPYLTHHTPVLPLTPRLTRTIVCHLILAKRYTSASTCAERCVY